MNQSIVGMNYSPEKHDSSFKRDNLIYKAMLENKELKSKFIKDFK